jgi:hypothetical protein
LYRVRVDQVALTDAIQAIIGVMGHVRAAVGDQIWPGSAFPADYLINGLPRPRSKNIERQQ